MPIFCPALTQWGSRDHKSGCHCCSPGVSACLWALLLLTKTHTNCFRTQGPTCLSSGENFPDDRPTCLLETHIASVSWAGINFAAGQSLVALKSLCAAPHPGSRRMAHSHPKMCAAPTQWILGANVPRSPAALAFRGAAWCLLSVCALCRDTRNSAPPESSCSRFCCFSGVSADVGAGDSEAI